MRAEAYTSNAFMGRYPYIAKLLGQNTLTATPSDAEVHTALSKAEFELLKLDAEIERVKTLYGQLVQSRAQLGEDVRTLKALVTPAKRLPVELWEQVFMHCLPTEESQTHTTNIMEAPLVLARVCKGWRNLVLSSPRLWTSLTITTTARHERKHDEQKFMVMIEAWLKRCKSCPFSISLISGSQFQAYRSQSSRLTPIWKALLPHTFHWRCLDLRVPESSLAPLLTCDVHDFPMLETLKLDVTPEAQAQPPCFSLGCAPRLRNVILLHVTFDVRPLNIIYSQLTEITLLPQSWANSETFFTLDECLEVLAQAVQLRSCAFAVEDVMPGRTTAVLSNVEEFHISFRDSDRRAGFRGVQPARIVRLGQFFDLLQMPLLRDLTVGNYVGNFADSELWPQESFLSYIARSAPPLESLHLIYIPLFETEVIDTIGFLPSLTCLVLEARQRAGAQRSVGDLLLSSLTEQSQSPFLLPRLETLDFRYCGKRCTESAIIAFVDSRKASLKAVKIHISHRPSHDLSAKATYWDSLGLDVEITHQEVFSI